ncbi:Hypp8744 [Branchiostoma lanceolatum]|uniref:Hypp8744 protein n=1 Tax=Branchiostoma lanceolatum TaxID=7740 RepID=A0A8J9Z9Z8_BRALA|nr:Hypp8744 [Branchiostoma lanceolatum]
MGDLTVVEVYEGGSCNMDFTDHDVLQIESAFRSYKTEVFVCAGLANLYFASVQDMADMQGWKYHSTGIPTVVFDTGDCPRRKRKLRILLAERGTGFILWQDSVDNYTNYKAPDKGFHTMMVSTDRRKLAGFSFDDEMAASDFLRTIWTLTTNPDVVSPMRTREKKHRKKEGGKVKFKLPKKCDISQPCCFQHIIAVEEKDRDVIPSLGRLCPRPPSFTHAQKTTSDDNSASDTCDKDSSSYSY